MPFDPERRIADSPPRSDLERLAGRVGYGGNPEHKRRPGDFEPTPPGRPRPDKSLCDRVDIERRDHALRLLRSGIERGSIGAQRRGGFSRSVWSVTGGGYPVEAQLENAATGVCHGYPMPETDPFRDVVLKRWSGR